MRGKDSWRSFSKADFVGSMVRFALVMKMVLVVVGIDVVGRDLCLMERLVRWVEREDIVVDNGVRWKVVI